jgi:hypothetical protein
MLTRRRVSAGLTTAALFLASPAHATALVFSQDLYTYTDPAEPSLSMTVELHDLDATDNTFRFTASGTIHNHYPDVETFVYYPDTGMRIMLWGPRELEPITASVVDWSIPSGLSVIPEDIGGGNDGGVLVNGNRMSAYYPTLAEPFDWTATFEVAVPNTLVGDYYLYSGTSRNTAGLLDGTWYHLAGYSAADRDFFFSILPIPEPASALLLTAGILTLAIRARRA